MNPKYEIKYCKGCRKKTKHYLGMCLICGRQGQNNVVNMDKERTLEIMNREITLADNSKMMHHSDYHNLRAIAEGIRCLVENMKG